MSFCKLPKIILFCFLTASINLNSMIEDQQTNEVGIEIPVRYSRDTLLSLSASPLVGHMPKDMPRIEGITIEESEETN